jgi:raffinose/stachyose/melibiose transport system permease protein
MFKLIYTYEYGLLNYFVTLFGGDKHVWITANSAIFLVTIPIMWQYVGFYFIIFLAGISKIPQEIYESADLDGISSFRKAVSITIPLMRDVITSSVILVISGCFKVFDMVYIITGGGPLNSSELLSTYMYNMAFIKYNGGYASAIAIVMIILGTGITIIMRRLLESKNED